MFLITTAGGMNLGVPDVCNTPAAAGAPVPVPYPNISSPSNALPPTTAMKVLVQNMPAVNQNTKIPMSNGDEAGVQLGVVSGMIMGPTSFILGSKKVMMGGALAQRLTSTTGQNGTNMNCTGINLVPSQTKVLLLG